MEPISTHSKRIDAAFGPLLMAKDILDQVIPHSDDGASIAMANAFAGELIELAVRQLVGERENCNDDNVVLFGS